MSNSLVKLYLIRAGFSFVLSDGTSKAGGEQIELSADVAADHAHKLEEVVAVEVPVIKQEKAPAAPKKGSDKPASNAPPADTATDAAAASGASASADADANASPAGDAQA